jgi:asparagine synthase (glutamine-hydrolysing)
MCGICGAFSRDVVISIDEIKRMTRVMEHRGPDNEGFYSDDHIFLGHRRLKIIALESGNQPIHNEDGTVWVVFNGEIYNHKELREILIGKGHHFYTESDTEVIIHLYEEYGETFTKFLDGDFAIALWNSCECILILARDRIGVKPLYYSYCDGCLIFASEIKAILQSHLVRREVNHYSISQYLTYGFVPAPHTIFKNIMKLPAGCILKASLDGIQTEKYWDLDFKEEINESASSEKMISKLMENAVKKRLMADVPLGAFLSGGVDSSLVVALMRKLDNEKEIETYTVGYDEEEYSELAYARLVAEKCDTDHRELVIGPDDYWRALPKFIWHEDEPSIAESGVAFQLLSEYAGPRIRVALCGEGADEVFAGYYSYYWFTIERYNQFRNNSKTLQRILSPVDAIYKRVRSDAYPSVEDCYFGSSTAFNSEEKLELIDKESDIQNYQTFKVDRIFKSDLHQMMYVDFKTWLPDSLLMVEDKMGMASSIEGRVPFLDYDLIDYSSRIDNRNRISGGVQKRIVRRIARTLIPSQCLERKKMGFSTPFSRWIGNDLYDNAFQIVLDGAKSRGVLDCDYIENIFKRHRSGSENLTHKIWLLLNLELWFKTYIDTERPIGVLKI